MTRCKGCSRCFHGFTGAGCLLVDITQNEIILIREVVSNKYNDMGGKIEQTKGSIPQNVSCELYEETAMTVSIDSGIINKAKCVDISSGTSLNGYPHMYRSYILYVNKDRKDVSCTSYYKSLNRIMYDPTIGHQYKETSAMTRFSIDAIKRSAIINGRVLNLQRSINGDKVALENRICKVLALAIDEGKI
ncbi:MAG: hypothetical protein EOP34_09525 [Rickettsiales bacterium]|nr:MAG: hypothetical protein EOP34_09525 [Rickettsiales bacterium]